MDNITWTLGILYATWFNWLYLERNRKTIFMPLSSYAEAIFFSNSIIAFRNLFRFNFFSPHSFIAIDINYNPFQLTQRHQSRALFCAPKKLSKAERNALLVTYNVILILNFCLWQLLNNWALIINNVRDSPANYISAMYHSTLDCVIKLWEYVREWRILHYRYLQPEWIQPWIIVTNGLKYKLSRTCSFWEIPWLSVVR